MPAASCFCFLSLQRAEKIRSKGLWQNRCEPILSLQRFRCRLFKSIPNTPEKCLAINRPSRPLRWGNHSWWALAIATTESGLNFSPSTTIRSMSIFALTDIDIHKVERPYKDSLTLNLHQYFLIVESVRLSTLFSTTTWAFVGHWSSLKSKFSLKIKIWTPEFTINHSSQSWRWLGTPAAAVYPITSCVQ